MRKTGQHNINIVPKTKNEEDKTQDARKYGNLIHEILAQIITFNDIEKVIYTFTLRGLISQKNQENITELIKKVVFHNDLKDYFTNQYKILTEREILTQDGSILIPDRLIFNNKQVIILDYKTGKQEKKHFKQINSYANALEKMNYKVIKKLLVYIDDNVLVVKG